VDRADGNVCAVKNTEERGKSENPIRINRQDKNAMKSVMRTIERVVTQDERKRIVTLRPKGTKSDYNDCGGVVGNGQTVSGSQVASKVFTIICDVELGKPHKFPEYPGSDPVRTNDGLWGRGIDKKRMAACNELYKGSKFALTRKGADLSSGVSLHERRQTCECK